MTVFKSKHNHISHNTIEELKCPLKGSLLTSQTSMREDTTENVTYKGGRTKRNHIKHDSCTE